MVRYPQAAYHSRAPHGRLSRLRVIGVDFAPRHSAWAVLDTSESSFPLLDYGAVDLGPEKDGFEAHVERLANFAAQLALFDADVLVIEDVTHFMTKPAQVLRLQGAFRAICLGMSLPTPTMVLPAVWQQFYGWHKTPGTTSKGFAKFVCSALNYEISGTVGKQTVDVRDAVLIARWYVDSGSLCYTDQVAT